MNISKGFQYTFLSAALWAVSIVLVRMMLNDGENVYNLAFWTSVLAAPYWLFIFSKHTTEFRTMPRRNYWILGWMALIGTVGVIVVEMLALKYSPAINYSFLVRSSILFTIVFAYLFLGEKITAKKMVIVALILMGTYFLTTNGQSISFTTGDIFTLVDAAFLALGNTVLGKMATNAMSTGLSASAGFILGIFPIALIALYAHAIALPQAPLLLLALTFMFIGTRFSRFVAYKNATASLVTMVFSFTPVFVSFMAIPFLGETMTSLEIAGGVLIILAGIAVEKLKI